MDYITTKEAAIKWGISDRRVLQYCNDNRIDRAVKMSNVWLIPKDAKSLLMGDLRMEMCDFDDITGAIPEQKEYRR